jgi:hypothetical protein
VSFASAGTNVVAGDTNGFDDLFVRDRVSGRTQLVSTTANLTQLNHLSLGKLSGDGRYVAFSSVATNVVVPDTNDASDVFVRAALVPQIDTVVAIDPNTQAEVAPVLHPGPNKLRVRGAAFGPVVSASLGNGVTASVSAIVPNRIELDVTVAQGTPAASRDLVVNNAGSPAVGDIGSFRICSGCVTIAAN